MDHKHFLEGTTMRSHTSARQAGRSIRKRNLHVEQLESRWLLSEFTVNDPSDNADPAPGVITLVWAINQANGKAEPTTIHFASPMTINSQALALHVPATINPEGLPVTITYGLEVASGSVFNGITVTNGALSIASGSKVTGCNTTGIVGLNNDTITGNSIGGLSLDDGNTVSNNSFSFNPSGYGGSAIGLGDNNTLTDNSSDGWNVDIGGQNVLQGNHSFGGLFVQGSDNQVIGNTIDGYVAVSPSTGNLIKDNLIQGGNYSIQLSHTQETQVVGNTIVGSWGNGVWVINDGDTAPANNVIKGNFIGTDSAGDTVDSQGKALGNAVFGVLIQNSSGNTIGGASASDRNVISNNGLTGGDGDGIAILGTSTSNIVLNNYIGTSPDGTRPMPNHAGGVDVVASGNTIGAPGAGNLISANDGPGVYTSGDLEKVQGNMIGTDSTGALPLGNTGDGVDISGNDNAIGGTTAGAGNVISGNGEAGITILGKTGDTVQGNFIGTDMTGTKPVGNSRAGVTIWASTTAVTIGGTTPAARNVISSNGGDGIYIFNASSNTIEGNYIGTDARGNSLSGTKNAFANKNGVSISSGSNNVVGAPISSAPGCGSNNGSLPVSASNLIRGNTGDGVLVNATGNLVSLNVIYGNGHMGIDLGGGISTLEPAYAWQTYPILSSVSDANGKTMISGRLESATPGKTYLIELYANAGVDASGLSEGQWFLGTVKTSYNAALGFAPIHAVFATPAIPGATLTWNNEPVLDHFITGIAIAPDGNTSEFSPARDVLRGSVKVKTNGPNIGAWFYPGTNRILGRTLNMNQAAAVCGVDHFNWIQYVTPPSPWQICVLKGGRYVPVSPAQSWDPVENFQTSKPEFRAPGKTPEPITLAGGKSDNFPFYLSEVNQKGSPFNLPSFTTSQSLNFADAPHTTPSIAGSLSFQTYLVGLPFKPGAAANATSYIPWVGVGTGFKWKSDAKSPPPAGKPGGVKQGSWLQAIPDVVPRVGRFGHAGARLVRDRG
jgi:parallel beta-helix repeat protein